MTSATSPHRREFMAKKMLIIIFIYIYMYIYIYIYIYIYLLIGSVLYIYQKWDIHILNIIYI